MPKPITEERTTTHLRSSLLELDEQMQIQRQYKIANAIAKNTYEGTKDTDILTGRNKEHNEGIHIPSTEHSRSVQNMLSYALNGLSIVPRLRTHSRRNRTYNARIQKLNL